jgi:hypothetical protein
MANISSLFLYQANGNRLGLKYDGLLHQEQNRVLMHRSHTGESTPWLQMT